MKRYWLYAVLWIVVLFLCGWDTRRSTNSVQLISTTDFAYITTLLSSSDRAAILCKMHYTTDNSHTVFFYDGFDPATSTEYSVRVYLGESYNEPTLIQTVFREDCTLWGIPLASQYEFYLFIEGESFRVDVHAHNKNGSTSWFDSVLQNQLSIPFDPNHPQR